MRRLVALLAWAICRTVLRNRTKQSFRCIAAASGPMKKFLTFCSTSAESSPRNDRYLPSTSPTDVVEISSRETRSAVLRVSGVSRPAATSSWTLWSFAWTSRIHSEADWKSGESAAASPSSSSSPSARRRAEPGRFMPESGVALSASSSTTRRWMNGTRSLLSWSQSRIRRRFVVSFIATPQ